MTASVLSRIPALAAFALLTAAAPCLAQSRHWLVDAAGGAGVDFLDLPPAVAAAASGDVIFVRAGDYSGFTTSKGVRILALPATSAPLAPTVRAATPSALQTVGVVGLPANESFSMVGVGVEAPAGNGAAMAVIGCAGAVHLEYCSFAMREPYVSGAPRPGLLVQQSPRVDVAYCDSVGYPGALFDGSTVRCTNSRFLGIDGGFFAGGVIEMPGHGLAAIASTIHVSRCLLHGGSVLGLAVLPEAGSGLVSAMSDWTIRSDAAGSVVAGSVPGRPVVAARGTGTVRYDPPSTFIPTGGGAETEPGLVATGATLPSLALVYHAFLGTMRVDVHGAAGDLFVFLFGLPSDPIPIPGLDELLLEPGIGPIGMAAGTIDASRYASATFPIPNVPGLLGTLFGWQAVRSGPGGSLALSNRTTFVYR